MYKYNINIRDYLPTGKENAIHMNVLTNVTGLSDSTIKAMIRNDRRTAQEPLVCSGSCGYYLAKDESESDDFRRKYTHNAITTLTIARALDKAFCNIKGQGAFDWQNDKR